MNKKLLVSVVLASLVAASSASAHGLGGHSILHKGSPCVETTAHGIGDKIGLIITGWIDGACPVVSPSPSPSVAPTAPSVEQHGAGGGTGGDCEKSTDPGACGEGRTNSVWVPFLNKWVPYVLTCTEDHPGWKGFWFCDLGF